MGIHIPGVTDSRLQPAQPSRSGNANQSNKSPSQNNFHSDRDYNNESKNSNNNNNNNNSNNMRSIPVNIDDLPVGNGGGSNSEYVPKGSGAGGSYDNESNAESRFASSSNKNIRKNSSPRGGGKGDYHDDNNMSSPAHGQNSEVAYMTGDKGVSDQSKSRNAKSKDNGSYDIKDSFSGNNDAHRYMMMIFHCRNFKHLYTTTGWNQLPYQSHCIIDMNN